MRWMLLTTATTLMCAIVARAEPQCGALLEPACLQKLGAGASAAAGKKCTRQLSRYRDCLAEVVAAADAPGATSPAARANAAANGLDRFDGVWFAEGTNRRACPKERITLVFTISQGRALGQTRDGRLFKGTVTQQGVFEISGHNRLKNQTLLFAGTLTDKDGSGDFIVSGVDCAGDATYSKKGP